MSNSWIVYKCYYQYNVWNESIGMYLVVEVLYTKVPNLGKFVLVSPLMSKHFLYIRKRIIIIVIDAIVKSCTHHIHDWKNVFCLFPCCNIGKKPPDHVHTYVQRQRVFWLFWLLWRISLVLMFHKQMLPLCNFLIVFC